MRELTEAAKAAKQIREKLKALGLKSTVKSQTYSMGSSVRIVIFDQCPEMVQRVRDLVEPHEYGTFDSMTDCSGFKNGDFDGAQAKHVFVDNRISDDLSQAIWDYALATYSGFDNAPKEFDATLSFYNDDMREYGSTIIHQIANGSLGEYWKDKMVIIGCTFHDRLEMSYTV